MLSFEKKKNYMGRRVSQLGWTHRQSNSKHMNYARSQEHLCVYRNL